MTVSSKFGIRVVDLYFDEPLLAVNAGLIRYNYRAEPVPGSRVGAHLTTEVDLRSEPASLLGAMAKSTRYDIKRAERDGGLTFHAHRDSVPLREFVEFFNIFAVLKGTHKAYEHVLERLADNKLLVLSSVSDREGNKLVWHAYVQSRDRARLLYSGSTHVNVGEPDRRQFLARANRYHHWLDILFFREAGVTHLDLGGICDESCHDPALRGIREFKTGFGGKVVQRFDSTQALSLPVRTGLWLMEMRSRFASPLAKVDNRTSDGIPKIPEQPEPVAEEKTL